MFSAGKFSSIYVYITKPKSKNLQKYSPVAETLCETVDETLEISNFKGFEEVCDLECETKEEAKCETFNIENINKELNKNNIYYRVIEYLYE